MVEVRESGGTQIASIRLDPSRTYPETISVTTAALPWKLPGPGEYIIKLKVAESATGEPQNRIDLKIKVTARYDFIALTEDGRLNIKATAGKESYLPITITNTGTATLDKITFSSSKPEKWSVTFKPEKIESLTPGDEQEVEVTVKPPSETISGDYMVTLKFSGEPTSHADDLKIRVAVGTSTRWGLIGVGIVIAVIAGLVVGFRQLGRR
jgi:uncharacterized membrane protein